MISVLNFKSFERGSIKGFFDLRYYGLTIKSCRLMDGNNGLWFSFPQTRAEENGETKWFDMMFMSSLERDHVRKLVLLDLQQQGHLGQEKPKAKPKAQPRAKAAHETPEGEDLSEHYTQGQNDDIPF